MTAVARTSSVVVLCLSLSGCYVKMYGNQSTSGGGTTTVTSGQVSGSTSFAGGKVAFSSGQRVAPSAPGGFVSVRGSGAAALLVGVIIADFFNYAAGFSQPRPLPPGTSIADTCSCYKKDSDEVQVTR